jgi:hypothetical protein
MLQSMAGIVNKDYVAQKSILATRIPLTRPSDHGFSLSVSRKIYHVRVS